MVEVLRNRCDGGQESSDISEMIKTNSTLTALDLGPNSIGEKGAQVLFEALRVNKILTALNLGSNTIKDRRRAWLLIESLIESLKANRTLTTLDLTNDAIGEKGTQVIFEVL